MSQAIMLQGTASDVGKSVLAAGLCRIFADLGYSCAPFKAQNMALNSGITASGAEMGRAQIVQAQAARIAPDVRMNPVLLKPTGDSRAQVIVMGKVLGDMNAADYHQFKPKLRECVHQAFSGLAASHQRLVIEGAGSPAEINLRDRDIVNMGLAEQVNAPVILVADIDRGGVFAAIYGTLALLKPQERARVKGVIINKFRGDVALLMPGIREIEALTQVPVLGVVPYLEVDIEPEDGVVLQPERLRAATRWQAGDQPLDTALDIAVIKPPHIANFTDFNALAAEDDVALRYVSSVAELGEPDAILLPGSKNTLDDLRHLNHCGLSAAIISKVRRGTPIFGVCGGYQMLGNWLIDGVESSQPSMAGLGLLDCVTEFARCKQTAQVSAVLGAQPHGLLHACQGMAVSGYEIHMGATTLGPGLRPFATLTSRNGQALKVEDGAVSADGLVAGSYIHGLFDCGPFARQWLNQLRIGKGLAPIAEALDYQAYQQAQFDKLAAALRSALDIGALEAMMAQFALTLSGGQPTNSQCAPVSKEQRCSG